MQNLKTSKNKDGKDTIIKFCYSSNLLLAYFNKSNSFNKNLLKIDNVINKIFFINKNKEKLIFKPKKSNKSYLKI